MRTPPQKQQRVECSRAFLDLCNEEEDRVLSRTVTGDETFFNNYDSQSEQDYMQWYKKDPAPPKIFKL